MPNHRLFPGQREGLQEFRNVNDAMVKLNWQHVSQTTEKASVKIHSSFPLVLS